MALPMIWLLGDFYGTMENLSVLRSAFNRNRECFALLLTFRFLALANDQAVELECDFRLEKNALAGHAVQIARSPVDRPGQCPTNNSTPTQVCAEAFLPRDAKTAVGHQVFGSAAGEDEAVRVVDIEIVASIIQVVRVEQHKATTRFQQGVDLGQYRQRFVVVPEMFEHVRHEHQIETAFFQVGWKWRHHAGPGIETFGTGLFAQRGVGFDSRVAQIVTTDAEKVRGKITPSYTDFQNPGVGGQACERPLGEAGEQLLDEALAKPGIAMFCEMVVVHGWPCLRNKLDFSAMTSHTGRWRKPLLNIAKTAATILLLVWLFRTFPMQDVFSRLRDMNWGVVLLALVLGQVVWILQAWRWRRTVLAPPGGIPPFRTFLYYTGVGYFFNVLLPSGIGGDAVKSMAMGRSVQDTAASVAAVFFSRVMGVSLMLATFWFAWLLWSGDLPLPVLAGMGLLTMGTLAGWIVLLGPWKIPGFLQRPRLARVLEYRRYFGLRGRGWSETFAIQALTLMQQWLFFRAVGVEMPFLMVALCIPPITLLTMVPISLYGMGVREWATVGLFTLSGFGATECLAASGPAYLLVFVQAAIGGLWLAWEQMRLRNSRSA